MPTIEAAAIIQYWHEEAAPDYIEELLASFPAESPGLRHLVFSESTAEAFIEEHLGSPQVDAFRACAVPAMQADYFRYCAVLVLGGLYCDADERCVADLQPLIPGFGAGRLFARASGVVVNGLFAFGSPRHALLELALEIATANVESRRFDRVYTATGPLIFTALYWLWLLGSFDALIERAALDDLDEPARAYCETIGDCARVTDAFEGVRVSTFEESRAFVRAPEGSLPYKATDAHWIDRGQIFR